jgi:hypothetical protein
MHLKQPNKRRKHVITVDPKLVEEVLDVVSTHVGPEKAISRACLVSLPRLAKYRTGMTRGTFDRKIRAAIRILRNQEHLICSSSGDGGYYMARNWAEYDAFAAHEYRSKIGDMRMTLTAMDRGAKKKFGPRPVENQPELLTIRG